MEHRFSTEAQNRLFKALLRNLEQIGYSGALLQQQYRFTDHFAAAPTDETAPAVAFGQFPPDPNTACFAIALSNGDSGAALINRYRALGAPRAFEVRDNSVIHWRVTPNVSDSDRKTVIRSENLEHVFRVKREAWSPASILRAKNIAPTGPRQQDFIDAGLMPALESHVREKLDPLLREALSAASRNFHERHGGNPDANQLFRLVFRALTGKVMHDRGMHPFDQINGPVSPNEFLNAVALHYDDPKPIIEDLDTQRLVLKTLWRGVGLAHLSIDVLAFVWENTLVSDEVRAAQGIHATPPNVARFIARSLIEEPPANGRLVVEPCCGSGAFLIAALQRIRELLPPDTDLRSRHRYFANILRGFDTETFGIEVSQSCLTLADFPNPNGWYLKDEDVFGPPAKSPRFNASLGTARFVLCNPPFENFSEGLRAGYGPSFVQRPAELLGRILEQTPIDAEIGFVLPHQIIDGRSYSSLRVKLGERFESLDVVQLPEGIFQCARFPSALVVVRNPRPHNRTRVRFSVVSNPNEFVRTGAVDRTDKAERSAVDLGRGISVVDLGNIWGFLSKHPKLQSAVNDIARGVEWERFDRAKHISKDPRPGTLPGFYSSKQMRCFEAPPLYFLDPADRRRNAWDKSWHLPKVVCNAVRKSSTGPWKIAAFPVELNLLCTQNFTVLWPKTHWTAKSLAAVLNGPVANAFMDCHETWKHLTKENLRELPLPNLTPEGIGALDGLVAEYQRLAALKRDGDIAEDHAPIARLRAVFRQIDWIVLKSYDLPHELLEALLEYFGEQRRPAAVQYDIMSLIEPPVDAPNRDDADSALWNVLDVSLRENRV